MPFFKKNEKNLSKNLLVDGPYVFYESDKINIVYVNEKQKQKVLNEETYSYSQKESITLKCVVDNQTRDSFSFKLKNKHDITESSYESQNKIFVISDLEGNFYALSSLLKGNGIVNKNLEWTFSKNHLVIIGDIMDRGINVTECLWLIYKLEQEAEKIGGKVHFLLGNHEILNMQGITPYVEKKYIDLANWLDVYYSALYSPSTELGKWLRSKNTIEIIGNIAFVHAGICPELIEQGFTINEINNIIRKSIERDSEEFDNKEQLVLGNKGPLWYRGIVRDDYNYFQLTNKEVEDILNYFNINSIVIGHTKADDITSLHDGKVIRTDIFQPKSQQEGEAKALLIENEKFYKVNNKGVREII